MRYPSVRGAPEHHASATNDKCGRYKVGSQGVQADPSDAG